MVTDTKEIIIAVIRNPNFFDPLATPGNKLKQINDLIENIRKTENTYRK